jgi:SET domain-containing protein
MARDHRRRIVVRRSPVHGRGLFALRDIPAGERIIEYRGEVIAWDTARARYDADTSDVVGHTFFFDRGDGTVIDGGRNGNSARYLNHGCQPNCEAVNDNGRIYIDATRPIDAGAELLIDYALQIDDPSDEEVRASYACRCAASNCRKTMLLEEAAAH